MGNPANDGMIGVLSDSMKRFERKIAAASTRETYEAKDGVYELRERPPTGSKAKLLLPMGYREGDKVWVRVREFQDFGYANGWPQGNEPALVANCRILKHELESSSDARCVKRYTCSECGYFYRVDSTD